jgi:hypothetical protein
MRRVSTRRALIIPDCHFPYVSKRAYSLMLEIASFVALDEIVLLGDYADFYSVSRHLKDPSLTKMLTEEIQAVNEGLDQLDKLWPSQKKVFLVGNHEARLETYILNQAPGLFGVTDIRYLFELDRRPSWSYQRFDRHQSYKVLGSDLRARHRPLASNALVGLKQAQGSYCYGDIHKIQQVHAVALDGAHSVAFCPGWLGETRHRVFDYMPTPAQWQHGFAIASVDGSSKQFHHEIIEIKNNKAIFWGKVFKA